MRVRSNYDEFFYSFVCSEVLVSGPLAFGSGVLQMSSGAAITCAVFFVLLERVISLSSPAVRPRAFLWPTVCGVVGVALFVFIGTCYAELPTSPTTSKSSAFSSLFGRLQTQYCSSACCLARAATSL